VGAYLKGQTLIVFKVIGPRSYTESRKKNSMVLGDMKAAFLPSPSPGLWHARRLNSADVDSRVWLPSTRTYIAFAVPLMVWIYSRLGS